MISNLSRRSLLRTALRGAGVTVALPFLDCFLNDNGTALAGGAALPVRFGTWFWGCGMTAARWIPKTVGPGYEVTPELKPMAAYRDQVSLLTNFDVILDGAPNMAHISGPIGFRTGALPGGGADLPSFDVLIADVIGVNSRFRSLEVACTGDPKHSYSQRSAAVSNASETSPVALYTRIFGPEFQDPNAGDFKPDPKVMLRKSVMSEVRNERDALMKRVGAADRVRLDEYFTSLRQLEQQLELQLQKPPPAVACAVPSKPKDMEVGSEIEQVVATHTLMTQLVAMALACNQTRAFNVVFSNSSSVLRKNGTNTTHHQLTHEEPVDEKLGYQLEATYFLDRSMAAWGAFLETLAAVREGDGTLLDNSMVLAHSCTSYAKTHAIEGLPAMIAGKAGGRLRPGCHVDGNGTPASRIGFTAMQLMGVPADRWGQKSMTVTKPVNEIVV